MPRIRFEDLLAVYRNAAFQPGAANDEELDLTVTSLAVAELLARIDEDEDAAAETGIALLDDIGQVAVGATVKVRLGSPRIGLGTLARDVDNLLASSANRVAEPKRFFLVEPPYAPGLEHVPDEIIRYRKVLVIIRLFAGAASFLDKTRAELIFVKEGKIVLPIRYAAADLVTLDMDAADKLLGYFADDLHKDQKNAILFEGLIELCLAYQKEGRFEFVLRNLSELADKVAAGYRLFASSFSYAKIKSEFEDARIDYTQKIHKTIVDIQNQLLGIPVATIVVASQLKAPTTCGPERWVNMTVVVGAWIFVALLLIAIINQWMTLNVICDEVGQKKKNLLKDFAPISGDFVSVFNGLNKRIFWHKSGLTIVMVIGAVGGITATCFQIKISKLPPTACASSPTDPKKGQNEVASNRKVGSTIQSASPKRQSSKSKPTA